MHDGFAKFLVIFVQKYFLPMLQKDWKKKKKKKTLFGNFSKIQFLTQTLTI